VTLLWRDLKYSANEILTSLVANQWSRGNFYRRWIASVWLKLFKLLFIPSLPERKMLRAIILREILKVVFHSWMETHANWEQNGLMNWLHVPDHTRFPRATSKDCKTVLLLLSFFSYLKCQAKIFFKEKPVLIFCSLFVFYLNFWDKGINSAFRIIWRDYTIGWIN